MSSSAFNRAFFSCAVSITITLGAVVVFAQSASDFKEAAGKSGCRLIPYSSLRSNCESKGREVESYCKRKTWSCDSLDPEGLKTKIENVKSKIEALKKERDNLKSKRSSAKEDEKRDIDRKISDLDKEIHKFEDMISDWQRKLENEKKEIKERISIGKQCRGYREDVTKIFRDTKSKLQGERDPEIAPFAKTIIKKIESEEPGHKTQIELVSKGIEKCERML